MNLSALFWCAPPATIPMLLMLAVLGTSDKLSVSTSHPTLISGRGSPIA